MPLSSSKTSTSSVGRERTTGTIAVPSTPSSAWRPSQQPSPFGGKCHEATGCSYVGIEVMPGRCFSSRSRRPTAGSISNARLQLSLSSIRLRPVVHLHPRLEPIFAGRGLEDRYLILIGVESVLSQHLGN